jgi:hypothetical protein
MDRFYGTWILDPGASRYSGPNPPRSGTLRQEPAPNGLIVALLWEDADGNPHEVQIVFRLDDEKGLGAHLRDDGVLETWVRRNGVEVARQLRQVDASGLTLTITQRSRGSDAQWHEDTSVWHRSA